MSTIRLVPIGPVEQALLRRLRTGLERLYALRCEIGSPIAPGNSFHRERQQYHSSELLAKLAGNNEGEFVLAITPLDLFMPILTFVFGEAELGGKTAIVSYHRLRQSYYGLPEDEALLDERLLREAMHELGHNFGLIHCDDYECAMASSHSVEAIDLKRSAYCESCREAVPRPQLAAARRFP